MTKIARKEKFYTLTKKIINLETFKIYFTTHYESLLLWMRIANYFFHVHRSWICMALWQYIAISFTLTDLIIIPILNAQRYLLDFIIDQTSSTVITAQFRTQINREIQLRNVKLQDVSSVNILFPFRISYIGFIFKMNNPVFFPVWTHNVHNIYNRQG